MPTWQTNHYSVKVLFGINFFLDPSSGLGIVVVLLIALVLGTLHGITPDEHTWPITFSYSVGSYSTKGGMKAGFMFSAGFIIQRSILTTLGFVGLAAFYLKYNLDGYIYVIVGLGMFIAGYYILKGSNIHLPLDRFFGGDVHHSTRSERLPMGEVENIAKPVPLKVATVHGFIAGWGVGAYASIITFVLAPQMPNIYYAALVGTFFGFGTMIMQITLGAVFANIMRVKKLGIDQIKYIGRSAAARTLYLGGIAFVAIGGIIAGFPLIDSISVNTGNPLPNLNSIGVASVLVLLVVGIIGFGNVYKGYREIKNLHKSESTES